jgi:hypothetical protein
MSENEENNGEVEEVKKLVKLRNTVNNTEIEAEMTEDNEVKFRELLNMQNSQNNEVLKENTLLKQKLAVNDIELDDSHKAPTGGNTAPLSDEQVYGGIRSKKPNLEVQKVIDDALIKTGVKEYDDLGSMFTDLEHRAVKNEKDNTYDEGVNKILDQLTFKIIKGYRQRPLVDVTINPQDLKKLRDADRKENAEIHNRGR